MRSSILLATVGLFVAELAKWWLGPSFASGLCVGFIAASLVAFWEAGERKSQEGADA